MQDMDAREITLEDACVLLRKKMVQNALKPPRTKATGGSKGGRKSAVKKAKASNAAPDSASPGDVLQRKCLA